MYDGAYMSVCVCLCGYLFVPMYVYECVYMCKCLFPLCVCVFRYFCMLLCEYSFVCVYVCEQVFNVFIKIQIRLSVVFKMIIINHDSKNHKCEIISRSL